MSFSQDSVLVKLCLKLWAKYITLEGFFVSQFRDSLSVRLSRNFLSYMSFLLSGSFIAHISREDRYQLFASESAFVRNLKVGIHSFSKSISNSYRQSFFVLFFSECEKTLRGINWKHAKADSWFLKKIYHA